ncbi:MAG: AGE family epimerase/isomerase [Hyphomonas sp.]|uniref:AGE family epimerase/isomerase n=1 Tax=Hyphomonas sp. TaxID=87 RepID=UPI00300166E9
MSRSALKRRAKEARTWLTDACFPLWAERGTSSSGLFREALELDHTITDSLPNRVRVQARQTYVFAEALRLGWKPETSRDRVERGFGILTGLARRDDGLVGRTLSPDGDGLLDDTPDLYDIAFTLFAIAESSAVLGGNGETRASAGALLDAVDRQMRDRLNGGYAETLPPPGIREQNPHMHLLEACLSLHKVDPDGRHIARAAEIISLFETFFTAGPGGLLGERFAADWSIPAGRDADIIEPGHQFEWVWLLHAYATAAETMVHPAAEALYDFACATLDEAGRACVEVTRDGQPFDASRRTWPQSEALKAHLAMLEATGDERYAAAACTSFDVIMDEFLTPDGGWIDHYGAEGDIISTFMPASTGYHVVLAFAELIRVMKA